MVNEREGKQRVVDTTAVPILIAYFCSRVLKYNFQIEEALDVIESFSHRHYFEGYTLWSFNSFYPCDWESTSLAIYVLEKYGRIRKDTLNNLRDLLEYNTVENGTGVWVKDPYSRENAKNNDVDLVSSINILRLHYIAGTKLSSRKKTEDFIETHLSFQSFLDKTLYYTPAVGAFFARRIIEDFPQETRKLAPMLASFIGDIVESIEQGTYQATHFERALLGFSVHGATKDSGLIFHHARRSFIWYGSPLLYQLARANL